MSVAPPTPTAIGDRLKILREVGGLHQSDLADLLEVSAATVSAWECGRSTPPRARLLQYAEHFNPDSTDVLMDELMALRALVIPVQIRQYQEPSLLDVLKDIRWVLAEIRDRLPPRT